MRNSLRSRLRQRYSQLRRYMTLDIWQAAQPNQPRWRRKYHAILRVIMITLGGIQDNHLLNRAAAMSFYSLIAMGPLVAVIVMVSGFVLRDEDGTFAAEVLERVVIFLAPPVAEYGRIAADPSAPASETASTVVVNSELIALLMTMIQRAQSGTGGLIGVLVLTVIAIQLLITIEHTYNQIWGVSRGRSWGERVVFYWTFISLGAVLGFGSLGLFTASTVANFFNKLPFGAFFGTVFLTVAPFLGFVMITMLLASFYVFFPNTTVRWRPALIGALFVAVLLFLNNYFSVIYVHRVIENRSLYGSVGIIPVLMFGLYIFWFFLLLGGQLTHAVQNANYLTSRHAWDNISIHSREILNLAVFLMIARRFSECKPPPSADDLAASIRVPGNILNESLRSLQSSGWICESHDTQEIRLPDEARYLPLRPLSRITLGAIAMSLRRAGNNEGDVLLTGIDPVLDHYRKTLDLALENEISQEDLGSLLNRHSASESGSPGGHVHDRAEHRV